MLHYWKKIYGLKTSFSMKSLLNHVEEIHGEKAVEGLIEEKHCECMNRIQLEANCTLLQQIILHSPIIVTLIG